MDKKLKSERIGRAKGICKYKIAVASTDGIHIDQHFGRAEQFYIIEVTDHEAYEIIEKREAAARSNSQHDENSIQNRLIAIDDCDYVFAVQIGPKVKKQLMYNGIQSFDLSLPVEEAVKKIMEYNSRNGVIKSEQYVH